MSISIQSIPAEIWVNNILPHLTPAELSSVTETCKFLHEVGSDSTLWKPHLPPPASCHMCVQLDLPHEDVKKEVTKSARAFHNFLLRINPHLEPTIPQDKLFSVFLINDRLLTLLQNDQTALDNSLKKACLEEGGEKFILPLIKAGARVSSQSTLLKAFQKLLPLDVLMALCESYQGPNLGFFKGSELLSIALENRFPLPIIEFAIRQGAPVTFGIYNSEDKTPNTHLVEMACLHPDEKVTNFIMDKIREDCSQNTDPNLVSVIDTKNFRRVINHGFYSEIYNLITKELNNDRLRNFNLAFEVMLDLLSAKRDPKIIQEFRLLVLEKMKELYGEDHFQERIQTLDYLYLLTGCECNLPNETLAIFSHTFSQQEELDRFFLLQFALKRSEKGNLALFHTFFQQGDGLSDEEKTALLKIAIIKRNQKAIKILVSHGAKVSHDFIRAILSLRKEQQDTWSDSLIAEFLDFRFDQSGIDIEIEQFLSREMTPSSLPEHLSDNLIVSEDDIRQKRTLLLAKMHPLGN